MLKTIGLYDDLLLLSSFTFSISYSVLISFSICSPVSSSFFYVLSQPLSSVAEKFVYT